MCVPASVPSVLVQISLVNLVSEVGLSSLSVSECGMVEPQTFFFQTARRQRCAGERAVQANESKHGGSARPVCAPKKPVKAVHECLKNRAPPPPNGTP